MKKYFEVISKTGKRIRTTEAYWNKIVTLKHPVMAGKKVQVKRTLKDPELVKVSEKDKEVFLYYRKFKKIFVCAVVRHENGTGFIISCFPVSSVKIGVIVYEKSKIVS